MTSERQHTDPAHPEPSVAHPELVEGRESGSDAPAALLARREAVREEIRARLGLPEWSNLRGDDFIMLVEALDEASRIHVGRLVAEMYEIEDRRAGFD